MQNDKVKFKNLFTFWIVIFIFAFYILHSPSFAIIPSTVRPFPVIPYVMSDCYNKDWGKIHPEWGPVGGWWGWGQGHCPESGTPEVYLRGAKNLKIRLDDGREIPKPVGVGIPFTLENIQGWASRLNKPEFDNLAFIVAEAPGLYGEVTSGCYCDPPCPTPGQCTCSPSCDCSAGRRCFQDQTRWATSILEPLSRAFPGIPIFFQGTVNTTSGLAAMAAALVNKNIAVKSNGWDTDLDNAMQTVNGRLVGGSMGFASAYFDQIIVGFEPRHGENNFSIYWNVMEALNHHPDFFDIQEDLLNTIIGSQRQFGFPLMKFMKDHMQKTLTNTPDLWVVLRKSLVGNVCGCPNQGCPRDCCSNICCYTSTVGRNRICTGPQRTNFSYWLYQNDNLPGGRTVAFYVKGSNLPEAIKNHAYGYFTARRTDQGSGNPYMYFDIEDQYRLPSDKNSWEVTVTFANSGSDQLSIEYINKSGQTVKKAIRKGQESGAVDSWVDYKWTLADADFSANKMNGADFRINCEGDGDETLHRVFVKPIFIAPSPTPTILSSPTPPRRTPTPTSASGRTPTPIASPTPGLNFYSGWQMVQLNNDTVIPDNCQIIVSKENNLWQNFLAYLENLLFAPRKKKIWVKCH